ncbi:MAG: enoyl-CoA hydratase/isomerase family protein [Deltaproteobacteria bacterium]|nr:enoyl-CoA hydratase/isomerase family protein [Deltaproteobacteria bacterium]
MGYNTIQYEQDGPIGTLTYNRPQTINAMNGEMVRELVDFWRQREDDFTVKVIITRGAGEKGFCSGMDLKEFSNKGDQTPGLDDFYGGQSYFSKIYRLMRSCPQPIIAAVHGPAMGGGLSLTLASDICIASPDAMFCAQYINIGVGGADMGSSYFLWRIVGWRKAAEMCLTGNRIYAEEALRIGLVNDIHPRESLMAAAMEIAQSMASKSRIALHMTKEALNTALNATSLEDAIKLEDRNQCFMTMGGMVDSKIRR